MMEESVLTQEIFERMCRLCLSCYFSGKIPDKDLESLPNAKRILWSYFRGKKK